MSTSEAQMEAVIGFWLGDSVREPGAAETQRERWYRGGTEVDDAIRDDFEALVRAAVAGKLVDWEGHARGALALVILLDQFTRNIWRGTVMAYAGDARAYAVASACVASGTHRELPVTGRIFLYHPYHHAETLADQDRAVELVRAMLDDAEPVWHPYIERAVAGFGRHRDIVARFGRFPHRNAVLGRASTAAEQAWLADGAEHFGQGEQRRPPGEPHARERI